MNTRSCCCTVVECRTRDPKVPSSNHCVANRKSFMGPIRTIPWPVPMHLGLKDLKLSDVKARSNCGTVVECRTRDTEVPSSNPGVGKKKISHRSNQNNTTTNLSAPEFNTWNVSEVQSEQYHHQSLCTRLQYLKLSEVKIRTHHVTVVECRTRDAEVPSSILGVSKMNISHRSNQNNTNTHLSAPELITWNYQRWTAEVTWVTSGRVQD